MRLLLISAYYPPQPAIASRRVHAHATTLASLGWDVTVLTTTKHDDQRGEPLDTAGVNVAEVPYSAPGLLVRLRDHAGRRGARPGVGDAPGAPPRGVAGLMRSLRERTGVYSTLRMPDLTDAWVAPAIERGRALAGDRPFDAVLASSGPYTTLVVAERLKALGAARAFIAEYRDLWTTNHVAGGLFPFTLRERALEKRVLASADLVVTVSAELARELAPRTRAPVEVIHNGHAGRRPPVARAPGAGVSLVYTGTVYPRGQAIMPVLEGIALARRRHDLAGFRLVVAGTSCDVWSAGARDAGIADLLDARGLVPADEALALQDNASALLSIEWNDPTRGVLTAKVFEYLAARPPVMVVGPRGAICELVERCGRGAHAGATPESVADAVGAIAEGRFAPATHEDADAIAALSRRAQSERLGGLIERVASVPSGAIRP